MADATEELLQFVYQLQRYGMEDTLHLYYGMYRGTVSSNEDPEARGRVQVVVNDLASTVPLNIWISPMFDMAGKGKGSFWPPELGDPVRVYFHYGNPSQPFGYLGGWYGTGADRVPEFEYTNGRPEKRGFVTRMGHALILSEEADNEFVRLVWHSPAADDPARTDPSVTADRTKGDTAFVELTKTGSVHVANKNGSYAVFDTEGKNIRIVSEQGHSVTIKDSGIEIKDKDGNQVTLANGKLTASVKGSVTVKGTDTTIDSPLVKVGSNASMSGVCGEPLMSWLSTHTHPTGVGPSGPPLVPPTPTILSNSVKLKA